MWPYFAMLAVPSALALFYRGHLHAVAYLVVFVLFVLFVGLRHEVGADWGGYAELHWSAAERPLADLLAGPEPLSMLLFRWSEASGLHMLVSNVVAAIILVGGVMALARRTANPWLALVSATPYLIVAFGMSGVRQAMGAGIVLFVASKWDTWGILRKTAGVVGAALFHTSALVCEVFVLAGWRAPLIMRIAAAVPFVLVAALLVGDAGAFRDGFAGYRARYLEGEGIISPGSLFHIGLIVLPAMLGLLFRRRLAAHVHDPGLLRIGLIAAFGLLALNLVSTTAASRLTLYVYFLPMMVYPAVAAAFGPRHRFLLTFGFVVLNFAVLLLWLNFGNNAWAHLPYRNVIFSH